MIRALLLIALVGCGPKPPIAAPTLPAGTASVEADFYMGTLTLPAALAATPYLTVCGPAVAGRAAFGNIPAQPGPNTLVSRAFSGPCIGTEGSGSVLASGYGTGTIVQGAANDLTTVFGSGATTLH